MEGLLPAVSVDLSDPLRGCATRRWLEIGFGGGEHLSHQASLFPDVTMIGAEAFLNGVAKLLAHLEAGQQQNLRIHYGDARPLLEVLPDACLDRVYLLYPDPWPKERQKRRRFVNPENLSQIYRLLTPGGQFLFASDIPDYVDWTLEHTAAHGGFDLASNSPNPFENWIATRYEAKALREGRTSRYLTFHKRHNASPA